MRHRPPPGVKQKLRQAIAIRLRGAGKEGLDRLAFKPCHGKQPGGGKLRNGLRHGDVAPFQHEAVQRQMFGFALVIEFLAQAIGDFGADFGRVDQAARAFDDADQPLQLGDVGFHGARHFGILEFAGEQPAGAIGRPMHLAQRRRMRRLPLERAELRLPIGTEFRAHTPLHERPAHRGRVHLQGRELLGHFRRQEVRDGRKDLRDFHHRSLGPPERGFQRLGDLAIGRVAAEQARNAGGRGHAGEVRAQRSDAPGAGGEAIAFGIIGHRVEIGARGRMGRRRMRAAKFHLLKSPASSTITGA